MNITSKNLHYDPSLSDSRIIIDSISNTLYAPFIMVKFKGVTIKVCISDIVMVEAFSNYSYIHLNNTTKILTCKTLKSWTKILEENTFIRVHARYLINKNFIKFVDNVHRIITMHNDGQAFVSRRLSSTLKDKLKNISNN
jgi:DNA-binding LytR/AlgR family response regulator